MNILIFGDSTLATVGNGGLPNQSLPHLLREDGFNVKDLSTDGQRISRYYVDHNGNKVHYKASIADFIDVVKHTNSSHVILMAGANDYKQNVQMADFFADVDATFSFLKNAVNKGLTDKVAIVLPVWLPSGTVINGAASYFSEYCVSLEDAAQIHNLDIYDPYDSTFNQAQWYDGDHLNAAGHLALKDWFRANMPFLA